MSGFKCPERFVCFGTTIAIVTVMGVLLDNYLTEERFVELSLFRDEDIKGRSHQCELCRSVVYATPTKLCQCVVSPLTFALEIYILPFVVLPLPLISPNDVDSPLSLLH